MIQSGYSRQNILAEQGALVEICTFPITFKSLSYASAISLNTSPNYNSSISLSYPERTLLNKLFGVFNGSGQGNSIVVYWTAKGFWK